MKESSYWVFATVATIVILLILMFKSMELGLVDVVMQWLGILLAFLLAMISSEAAKIESEEKRAELVVDDLIEELRFVQTELEKPVSGKFYLATWISIRGTGLPDRIPHDLRRALAQAFVTADAYNDSADSLENYVLMPKIEQDRTDALKEIHSETKKSLQEAVLKVLMLHRSMKKSRFSVRRL